MNTVEKHILICGDIGVGKSTLINRLLTHVNLPRYGFITKRIDVGKSELNPIYIHPAGIPESERVYTDSNKIGICSRRVFDVSLDAFNLLGRQYILNARQGGIIVMDELGFIESRAEDFKEAVFYALSQDIPVIAAVKSRTDVQFLNDVRNTPKSEVFTITAENRDKLYESLIPRIRVIAGNK